MIKRFHCILIACIVILSTFSFWSLAEEVRAAQERKKVYMVLWRGVTDAERGFMEYIRQRNPNIEFLIRNCAKDRSKLPEFIQEIKETKPDLVYTFGTTVTLAVAGTFNSYQTAEVVRQVPIVFNIVADPKGAKLVENLESSKRNLTGTSHVVPIQVQIKAIRSNIDLKKLGVLYNPLEKNSQLAIKALEEIAQKDGFGLIKAEIPLKENKPSLENLSQAIKELALRDPDLVYLPSDSFIISNGDRIVDEIHRHAIPTFSATEGPIKNSAALMGLVSRYFNVGKFAGYKAERILTDGVHPQEIPIETLKRFTFLINMKSVKEFNQDLPKDKRFYPPLSVLLYAEVIN